MKKPIVLFNPTLTMLSKNESQVLELLIEAGKLVVPIYLEQENPKELGANFYPHGVTREEIEKSIRKDPSILSPYTVVEKVNGELIATPYHIKYAKLLEPVADKLFEAAKVTDNKEFGKRLEIQAKALLTGDYDEATIAWMNMKPSVLDINIGPLERYDDKLFFTKTSYQAWVGVMDEGNTKRAINYKDIIFSARRKALIPSEKLDFYDKVQIRVDDAILFSGLIARTMFVSVNLPNDTNFMKRYGSEITIFKQASELRFRKEVLPEFNKLFAPSFKKLFSLQEIELGTLYSSILHELGHVYLRYRHSERNLRDLFPVIDELAAYVAGIRVCGFLLLKDVASQKQLESIMLAFLARCFRMVLYEKDNHVNYHYMIGGVIFINYLLENEAIQEAGGISWPNFTKMFFSVGELANLLEKILASGSRSDAEIFIRKYGNLQKLQKFKK